MTPLDHHTVPVQESPPLRCGPLGPRPLAAHKSLEPDTGQTVAAALANGEASAIPDYLRQTYTWAYLHPSAPLWLDRHAVVSGILWGNYRRLVRATLAELRSDQRVLQPACVYGNLSQKIAAKLGPGGHLDVSDIAPLQIEHCRQKLHGVRNVELCVRDVTVPLEPVYDSVCCFFLLHEMPADYRRQAVKVLLGAVKPGGKVIFVDYHKPHWAHPLRGLMGCVFDWLEPFARGLWEDDIHAMADGHAELTWSKTTYFGGLYQKTVARRLAV